MELEEDECLWEINPLVTSIDELDVDATANIEGEWSSMEIKIWLTFLHLLRILYRQKLALT